MSFAFLRPSSSPRASSVAVSLYGMNFTKTDGTPGIPELTWGYEPSDPEDLASKSRWTGGITGYAYFWILSCVVIAVIIVVYICLDLITFPGCPTIAERCESDPNCTTIDPKQLERKKRRWEQVQQAQQAQTQVQVQQAKRM